MLWLAGSYTIISIQLWVTWHRMVSYGFIFSTPTYCYRRSLFLFNKRTKFNTTSSSAKRQALKKTPGWGARMSLAMAVLGAEGNSLWLRGHVLSLVYFATGSASWDMEILPKCWVCDVQSYQVLLAKMLWVYIQKHGKVIASKMHV